MAIAKVGVKAVDPAKGKGIVLFDGQCPLCQRSVRILKRLDWLKRLHFQDCRDTANLPKTSALDPSAFWSKCTSHAGSQALRGYRAFRWMAGGFP